MAYTTINKPADYFNTVLYTGDSATSTAGTLARTISGVGFQPDFTWVKGRTTGGYDSHGLHDVVRTAPKWLASDLTNAETDVTTGFNSGGIGSFTSDGFGIYSGTTGSTTNYNTSGTNYVAWNWLAGGTASSNTDGSITSSVSASTTSGFSIVTYSGSNSNSSVGHGLGIAPKMVIIKNRTSGSTAWLVGNSNIGWTKRLYLHATDAAATYNNFQDTAPTSSVFTLTGNLVDSCQSGSDYVAYCFAEKKGFSKFGSYTAVLSPGSEALGSPFVYTGFKPAMVILKSYTHVESWHMKDATRDPFNYVTRPLYANLNATEGTMTNNGGVDFYSNGFGINYGTGDIGSAGKSYIYMAFAENPLVTTGKIPATAR